MQKLVAIASPGTPKRGPSAMSSIAFVINDAIPRIPTSRCRPASTCTFITSAPTSPAITPGKNATTPSATPGVCAGSKRPRSNSRRQIGSAATAIPPSIGAATRITRCTARRASAGRTSGAAAASPA